ncbi:hypothetical protein TNCV_993991 [Trichonephila clavipes]|nr:hypothetical protein TNCV_993991 [Trichonephila clavipes]
MDFSSSDSEEENMDTHIDQRQRTPSAPVIPPAISVLEEDLQHIENASNCGNFLAEMFQLIDNINNYSFDSEEDKSTYHSRLVEICNEGTSLLESLRQLETDHLGDLIKRFHQKTGQSSTQNTPFKPIKGRKNNRKSPSPPPESASKKLKITEVETTNRFSNLQIEHQPIIEDEQEEKRRGRPPSHASQIPPTSPDHD